MEETFAYNSKGREKEMAQTLGFESLFTLKYFNQIQNFLLWLTEEFLFQRKATEGNIISLHDRSVKHPQFLYGEMSQGSKQVNYGTPFLYSV